MTSAHRPSAAHKLRHPSPQNKRTTAVSRSRSVPSPLSRTIRFAADGDRRFSQARPAPIVHSFSSSTIRPASVSFRATVLPFFWPSTS